MKMSRRDFLKGAIYFTATALGTIPLSNAKDVLENDLERSIENYNMLLKRIESNGYVDYEYIKELNEKSEEVLEIYKELKNVSPIDAVYLDDINRLKEISDIYLDYKNIEPPFDFEEKNLMESIELTDKGRKEFLDVLYNLTSRRHEKKIELGLEMVVNDIKKRNNTTTLWDVVFVEKLLETNPRKISRKDVEKFEMVYNQTLKDLEILNNTPFLILDKKTIGTQNLLKEKYGMNVDFKEDKEKMLLETLSIIGYPVITPIVDYILNAVHSDGISDKRALSDFLLALGFELGLLYLENKYFDCQDLHKNHYILEALPVIAVAGLNAGEWGTKKFKRYKRRMRM